MTSSFQVSRVGIGGKVAVKSLKQTNIYILFNTEQHAGL